MAWPEPLTLCSNYCILEPLSHDHCDDLVAAVRDGELWKLWYTTIPHPDEMDKEIARRRALQISGSMLAFAVIDNETQRAIGMTTYCQIDSTNKRLDIGFTWYAQRYHRTALNTSCKLMLLTHAFETLQCIAVGFRIDALNQRSQQAVERLGAKRDGIIRNYSVLPNGDVRDMVFYSILPHEWPHVKTHLKGLLNKSR